MYMYCERTFERGDGGLDFETRGWSPIVDTLQQIATAVKAEVCEYYSSSQFTTSICDLWYTVWKNVVISVGRRGVGTPLWSRLQKVNGTRGRLHKTPSNVWQIVYGYRRARSYWSCSSNPNDCSWNVRLIYDSDLCLEKYIFGQVQNSWSVSYRKVMGSRVHIGSIASGRQIARDDHARQEMASRYGILAYDSECYWKLSWSFHCYSWNLWLQGNRVFLYVTNYYTAKLSFSFRTHR